VRCALELSEDEVEEKLLKETGPFKVEKNQLIFSSPIEKAFNKSDKTGKKDIRFYWGFSSRLFSYEI